MSIMPEDKQLVENFLHSADFDRFLDEDLRTFAQEFVQDCLRASENRIKNSQLHSIPGTVQAGGLTMLRDLAKSQADKNTKEENKNFWRLVQQVLLPQGRDAGKSLFFVVEQKLRQKFQQCGLHLPDPESLSDNRERKARKKANKELCEMVLEPALPVFCEHFVCHYHYLTQGVTT